MDIAFASLPLEDTPADILGKAQRGLSLSDEALAARAGVMVEEIRELKSGGMDAEILRRVSGVLSLGARSLTEMANGRYVPANVEPPEGLFCTSTPYHDMIVNSFVLWDPETRDAAFFDTGSDAESMLDFASTNNLQVRQIFITHIHGDHILDLDRVLAKTGAQALVSALEPLEGAEAFQPGTVFSIGSLTVSTRRTSGHATGGITYVVEGLSKGLAIVGDAMFAGSMGGGKVSYDEALRTSRQEILSLPDETIICPGHGPLTTVGEQRRANPFFAD
jgi:glyoxylase-like metal-dependent hydrolase (beta-lactamase superfamily II)